MPHSLVKYSRGFTLVEVLVISPIVILFIGTFIALIVNLTGESLQLRTKNVAAYDVQTALDDIESSVNQATNFLVNTTGVTYSPQGKDNGTAAFTNELAGSADTLIIRSAATTAGPFSASREVIFTGTGASCNTKNAVYTYISVFFLYDESNGTKSLYKRTILPQIPACAPAWQRSSCNAAVMASNTAICKAQDEKLLDNVSDLEVEYYENASATDPLADNQAATSTSVSVKITTATQAAGKSIDYESSTRATSANAQTSGAEQTPPANPAITANRNAATPYTTDFSWQPVGSATGGYNVRYRIGTTTWTGPVNTNQTTFTAPAATNRKQNVDIEVSVVSNSGTYLYGTLNTTIPRWNDCTYENGWQSYGAPYSQASFTRTSSGIIGLRGLVRLGTVGTTICTLPVGFRPKFASEKLIFQAAGYRAGANSWARVDVQPTGEVTMVAGENGWVSLDGIMFLGDTTNYTWTNNTWLNGWSWYGAGHANLRSTIDSVGRVHLQGLGKYTGAWGTAAITSLGASKGVSNTTHSPGLAAGGAAAVNISTNGDILGRSGAANSSWQQMQLIYHPSTFASWSTLPFYNSFQNYGGGWPTAKCYKGADDVVIMTGLVNRASSGDGLQMSSTSTAGCGVYNDGRLLLPVFYAGELSGRIDIQNGSMIPITTSPTWLSLDGVRFIAD
jgi:hypothetical protein